jgi:hypothetical protein
MTKRKYCHFLLNLPLPVEILAKIATYEGYWYGATEQDVYQLLKHWESYKPTAINY